MRRFRVTEHSMLPTLAPGAEVVASDARQAGIGELVVFEHPRREGFWLIKRRVEPPHELGPGQAWVASDNQTEPTIDSSSLGPVPASSLLAVVSRLDEATFREACELLVAEDEDLASLLSQHGIPEFWTRTAGFPTLVRVILEQQVSLQSGAAAYRRLVDAVGEPSPESVDAMGTDAIRAAGITRQKAGYLIGLAGAIIEGRLDLDHISQLPPTEARAELMKIHGIGAWTADVYLLVALGHTDVFPIGDRALQVGASRALGLSTPPHPEELEIMAEPWRPVRAVAARLLWHAYLREKAGN
ncbi:MAG: hypothetical protein R3258_01730 [Acidimicrobiia bacterium]|nr:hypothetical protein [Acidimicrobiia bacterium]